MRCAEMLLTSAEDGGEREDDPEALLPIRSIQAVEANVPAVELSRQRVVEEMESMVQRGLNELVRLNQPCSLRTELTRGLQDNPLLASSLQTAHNLSVIPSLVESLVMDLTDAVSRKIKACFDMASLAREVGGKGQFSAAPSVDALLIPMAVQKAQTRPRRSCTNLEQETSLRT